MKIGIQMIFWFVYMELVNMGNNTSGEVQIGPLETYLSGVKEL